MQPRTTLQATIGAVLAAFVGVAIAHSDATGVVKERMELMEGMGESMEILADMFKGKKPFDTQRVEQAANRIKELAGEGVTRLFPAGSLREPSEALPEIWDDWELFETLAGQLEAYSGALAKAADNPQEIPGSAGNSGSRGMMMMGGGAHESMMGGGGAQGMMMGGAQAAPDPEHLANMPPQAAFLHLAETCNSCHTRFRAEKEHGE